MGLAADLGASSGFGAHFAKVLVAPARAWLWGRRDPSRWSIRVNALAPGYFGTEINSHFFATDAGKALIKRVPMRRLGELGDLDGPLLLLASDASRFMTGAVIEVDGGHLLSSL
jgi:NAD(P)-dependent dehydrogenase (short-subunit alcohol dehydrogenase family)